MIEGLLIGFVVVGGLAVWLYKRNTEKKQPVPSPTQPHPTQPHPTQTNWNDVWCNAVRRGMTVESQSAKSLLQNIRRSLNDENWQPPKCD